MNTYGPAVFFLILTIGGIGLLLVINLGSVLLNSLKTPALTLARIPRPVDGIQLRRAERHPHVICRLPIYEQRRPEQKLW